MVAAPAAHGVDTVFGIPGTPNLEIYRHLPSHGVRHIGTRHEEGAGYAADGQARATGRVGVALVTTGRALLNAAAAIGQAHYDSVPVLVISPGLPLRHPATGNGLLHETKDQQGVMRAVAAASLRPRSVEQIAAAVAQAFAIMTHGRPRRPACAEPSALAAAATWVRAASRPVILAGGGANRASVELAKQLGAPVVTSTNGKGVLPNIALVLGTDNAMVCYYGILANLPVYRPSSYLFPTSYGTPGYGLPAAIGAKVGSPDRPVVAVLGDGGVMFTVAELGRVSTSEALFATFEDPADARAGSPPPSQ